MYSLVIGLIIFVCVLLVIVVLLQSSKGGGIAAGFTGATQVMGVKRTSDLLEQLTWGFAVALMVLTLSTSFVIGSRTEQGGINSVNVERAAGKSAGAPAAPAGVPSTPNEKALTPDSAANNR
jgi:preprotein translocase subunit SecG